MACQRFKRRRRAAVALIRNGVDHRIDIRTVATPGERVVQRLSNGGPALSLASNSVVVRVAAGEHFSRGHSDRSAGQVRLPRVGSTSLLGALEKLRGRLSLLVVGIGQRMLVDKLALDGRLAGLVAAV